MKLFRLIALIVVLITAANLGQLKAQSQIYSTPGTYSWTVPPCVYEITAEVWGGGGGGGAVWSRFSVLANASDCESGDEICTGAGGGGGGGYARRTYAVTPGQTYTVVVGAGGAGGVINNGVSYSSAYVGPAQNGSTGGNSTFSGPATAATGSLTGLGGNGGQCANIQRSCLGGCGFNHNGEFGSGGTGAGGLNGTTMFNGGNGASGSHSASSNDKSGGGGGGAGSNANGGNASTTSGGAGGNASGGNGANGIVQPYGSGYLGTSGNNGSVLGGGGSGASSHHETSCSSTSAQSRVGGNGARGEVRITYTNPSQPTPTFAPITPICSGDNLSPLPTISQDGYTGTWSPALNNTATTTYTFTPGSGQCANTATLTITVNPPSNVPAFNQVGPVCSGGTISPLPNTSLNAITGSWSPSLNNNVTTTYTFIPASGQCASTASMTIAIDQPTVPTFTPLGQICTGAPISPLPTTSNNSINGSWSPALNNTATTTYTFTPTAGQCAVPTTMTITVGSPVTPTFNAIQPVCEGTSVNPLPLNSIEGISGSWSPVFNNMATTTYTFSPNSGQCATNGSLSVVVNASVTPQFQQVAPICSGEIINPLPTTSNNGITGVWSPALNNTASSTYTFTPGNGQCALPVDMTITVNSPSAVPTFPAVGNLCLGSQPPVLNSVSDNGISGTWSSQISTAVSGTQTYTFTPDPGACGVQTTVSVTVEDPVVPVFDPLQDICEYDLAPVLGNISNNGISGLWSSQINSAVTGLQTLNFTPDNGECALPATVSLTVNAIPVMNAGNDDVLCAGEQVTVNATGANTYTWSNGLSNGLTFTPTVGSNTYSVTGTDINGCTASDQLTIVVNPLPIVNAGSDQTICQGTAVTLTGSGANTYGWDNGAVNGQQFTPVLGNLVYTVQGTDQNGCIGSDQVSINVIPTPVPSFQVFGSGCVPLTITLQNSTPNATSCEWTISNGDILTDCNNVTTELQQAGCYDITLTTEVNGCVASFTAIDVVCAEEVPNAEFSFSPSTVTTLDTGVEFNNLSTGATNYVWFFGDGTASSTETDPVYEFPDDGSASYDIMLLAYSASGCVDTAFASLLLEEELIFWVPNTFTPDNDTYNQTFEPVFTSGFDPFDYHLTIFNRWGEIVFESYDHTIGWDGNYGGVNGGDVFKCQDGTYTWKIEFKARTSDERMIEMGHVNLIR